jgi:Mrp family chromosome partitioning ATPase
VIRADATTRDAVLGTLQSLRNVRAHVLGGVLNDVDPRRSGQGYRGGGSYGYYRSKPLDDGSDSDDGSGRSQSAA